MTTVKSGQHLPLSTLWHWIPSRNTPPRCCALLSVPHHGERETTCTITRDRLDNCRKYLLCISTQQKVFPFERDFTWRDSRILSTPCFFLTHSPYSVKVDYSHWINHQHTGWTFVIFRFHCCSYVYLAFYHNEDFKYPLHYYIIMDSRLPILSTGFQSSITDVDAQNVPDLTSWILTNLTTAGLY